MVSWTSGQDSTVSGYDPITKQTKDGIGLLTYNGTIDLNMKTRGFPPDSVIGTQVPASAYPGVRVEAKLTFTSADVAGKPSGWVMGAVAGMAHAGVFPPGVTPTPEQILLNCLDIPVSLGHFNSPSGHGVGSWSLANFESLYGHIISGGGAFKPAPNTKYWLTVVPAYIAPSTGGYLNPREYVRLAVRQIPGSTGRAISLWGNQIPLAPTITSPATGVVKNPGEVLTLSVQPNDPDAAFPDDPDRLNKDVAGVSFEYAPLPPPGGTPEWRYLSYTPVSGSPPLASSRRGSPPVHPEITTALGLPVKCGGDERPPGHGYLPGGTWLVRARTMDFGHPYPSLTANPSDTGSFSAWSQPVQITVAAQVPPPLPLGPRDRLAIPEASGATLSWQYRNSHVPTKAQAFKVVQIRKFGDQTWATVEASQGSQTSVHTNPVVPPVTIVHDPCTSLTGWTARPGNAPSGSPTISVVTGAVSGVSASRSGVSGVTNSNVVIGRESLAVTAPTSRISIQGHLVRNGPRARVDGEPRYAVTARLLTAAGVEVGSYLVEQSGTDNDMSDTALTSPRDWSITLEAGGAFDVIEFSLVGTGSSQLVIKDLLIETTPRGFDLEATAEYEWRVRALDTDGETSDFSTPARFWAVPNPAQGGNRPVPANTVAGATLGCGTHRAFIYRRGGLVRIGEVTGVTSLNWARVRDDISDASVTVKNWSIDCGNLLSSLKTWAYELVIFRDNGYSVDRVWEGPITALTYEADAVTIKARDMMAFAYRKIIKRGMSDRGSSVVARASQIIQDVFAPDDPNLLQYLKPIHRGDDAKQSRSVPAYSRTAFEEIDDMASNSGLDYTVVGRAILLWGTKHRIGTLPEFRDENLGNAPIVSEYGMSFANRYVVSDGNGLWGEASALDPDGSSPYGVVEMLSSSWATDSETDSGTFTAEQRQRVIEQFDTYASHSLSSRNPPPVVVRVPDNTTLNPNTVLSIQQLVPGVVVPLRSVNTLRKVVASQKLDSVSVTEEAGKETISIVLSPFSRDDANTGEVETE